MKEIIQIRASSLGALFDCPKRWSAIHLEKKRLPSTGKSILGQAIHASTAFYDQKVLDEDVVSVDESAAIAVDAIYKPNEEVVWEEDCPQNDAEKIAISLHAKYCESIAPTLTYKAIEIECERLEITDIGIALTGTTDRVTSTKDGLGIADLKTGKTVVSSDGTVKTQGHAFQQGVYELLASHAIGEKIQTPSIIIGMNTAKTPASQRVGIGYIEDAASTLVGDEDNPGVLQMASNIIHSGLFFGNPKSMMCHGKYCPEYNNCKFRR